MWTRWEVPWVQVPVDSHLFVRCSGDQRCRSHLLLGTDHQGGSTMARWGPGGGNIHYIYYYIRVPTSYMYVHMHNINTHCRNNNIHVQSCIYYVH